MTGDVWAQSREAFDAQPPDTSMAEISAIAATTVQTGAISFWVDRDFNASSNVLCLPSLADTAVLATGRWMVPDDRLAVAGEPTSFGCMADWPSPIATINAHREFCRAGI